MTPRSFNEQRNKAFSLSYLDLVQNPSVVAFLCSMVSKALFRKKKKKKILVSEISGHPVQMHNLDSNSSVRTRTISGTQAQLTLCCVDTHFMWL